MILAILLITMVGAPQELAGGSWEGITQTYGTAASDYFGYRAVMVSDYDGDTVEDIAVTAQSGSSAFALAIISGSSGALLAGLTRPFQNDNFGCAITIGSDIDGDGVAELYIGASNAPGVGPSERGAVYVLSGATLHELQHWWPTPRANGLGTSLCNIGDHNGDGVDDIAASAPSTSHSHSVWGRIEYRSGSDGALLFVLDSLTHKYFGESLAAVPDFDGDGKSDLLAGAKISYDNRGAVCSIGSLTHSVVMEVRGADTSDYLGETVQAAGDLNHDGVSEILTLAAGNAGTRILLLDGISGTLLRTFYPPQHHRLNPYGLLGGADFDGDGGMDVIAALHPDYPSGLQRLVLFRLDGSGLRVGADVAHGTLEFGAWLAPYAGSGSDGVVDILVSDRMIDAPSGLLRAGAVFRWRFAPALRISSHSLRAHRGGFVELTLDFPPSEGGQGYLLLASAAAAGTSTFAGITVPLVQDSLFSRMLASPPRFIHRARGTLDADGVAKARLILPAGSATSWLGRTIRFAAVCGTNGAARMSSVSQHLTILP